MVYAGIRGITLAMSRPSRKDYKERFPVYAEIPEAPIAHDAIVDALKGMAALERPLWEQGFASGAVYAGSESHTALMNQAYAIHAHSNPLHGDIWPSANKFEAEIVRMTAGMLHGPEACGTVSSGGTESILLAMKACRDFAREKRGITEPELIVPNSAHAAFDKAADYFSLRLVRVPVGADFRADVAAMEAAITKNTIALVGSSPGFPHGVVDPIEELASLAQRKGLLFHTDACLGGFLLPWAEAAGRSVPLFDFRVPGVTSMSVDTHKYGYAAKGTSVVLYRTKELRRYQYFATPNWPGGMYGSPTLAGSRPGGLSAACWASLVAIGKQGYIARAKAIFDAADALKRGVRDIPELELCGDSLFVIAFGSPVINVYKVLDRMSHRGWSLNGLHHPAAIHVCVTLRHTEPGVIERLVKDLGEVCREVRENPDLPGGEFAPIYGLSESLPGAIVGQAIKGFMDAWYEI